MPDMSDVGAPAKGPGLPHRVPEAPPPPVRVKIEHGWVVDFQASYLSLALSTSLYTSYSSSLQYLNSLSLLFSC